MGTDLRRILEAVLCVNVKKVITAIVWVKALNMILHQEKACPVIQNQMI